MNGEDPAVLNGGAKLPSQAEMAEFDRRTIRAGTPSGELMERAGQAVMNCLQQEGQLKAGAQIVILCGPGNNGGDGLVTARLLRAAGWEPRVLVAQAERYSADFLTQIRRYRDAGGEVSAVAPVAAVGAARELAAATAQKYLLAADLVVDALLGTGQSAAPRGGVRDLLELYSEAKRAGAAFKTVAIDLPTGSNGDTGALYDNHITADLCIAIELVKRGLCQYPARAAAGEIRVVSIGLDLSGAAAFRLLHPALLPPPPQRSPAAHKGDCGRVLLIGGSRDMPGAPLLAGAAALRSGAGLVTLVRWAANPVPPAGPELLFKTIADGGQGALSVESVAALLSAAAGQTVVVIGPGLGQTAATQEAVLDLLPKLKQPVVLDADALNAVAAAAAGSELQSLLPPQAILTPHPGEAARLLGSSSAAVQRDRYQAAQLLAERSGAVVVLKGAGTIVFAKSLASGSGWVDYSSANPFMATAGSGDVLAGIIAAWVGQGSSPAAAAAWGVLLHSRAGRRAAGAGRPLIASDIISAIAPAWQDLFGSDHG